MPGDTESVLTAASEIRGCLDELLDAPEAEEIRSRLDEVLDDAVEGDDEAANAVVEIITSHESTREWMTAYLASSERMVGGGGVGAGEPWDEVFSMDPSPMAQVNGDDGATSVYARIDCPDSVVAGEPFDATIGLSDVLDPNVFSTVFDLPEGELTLTVHVTADGIDLLPGQSWRNALHVACAGSLPAITLTLQPEPQDTPTREARIQALYLHDGHTLGFGSRSLTVLRSADDIEQVEQTSRPGGGTISLPANAVAPDLTIDIRRGRFPGELMWIFDNSHGLPVPDEAWVTNIGMDPQDYARGLIRRANQREGQSDLFAFLRGIGTEIADVMPRDCFRLLREVARATGGRTPLVQLFSEEPHIPWELAWREPRIDASAPAFLAAQANIGRWVISEDDPPFPAPVDVKGDRIASVWGVYDQIPGWQRLKAAEKEGEELTTRYQAVHVQATVDDVIACIEGSPEADVLHFAVHGNYDPEGGEDGLVLTDGRALDPTVVRGLPIAGRPFVFLNACQVGTGREILGNYGGMAMAFVRAGACGVVAPLWSIKDTVAHDVALDFYEKTRNGVSPAATLREARAAHGPEPVGVSGTYFAYQYFGHPALKLSVGDISDHR